jgi:hypothetical protein
VNEGKNAPAGGETISRFMSGWLKTGSASVIILLLTSAKKLLTAQENCIEKKLLTKFAHNEQIYCEQKFVQKICSRRIKLAHGESNLLMENHELPFILLAIEYGRMT